MSANLEEWMEESAKGTSITVEELDQLCKNYKEARELYDEAKKKSTDLNSIAEGHKAKLIEALELSGKRKYVVDGLGTFSFKDSMSVVTPKTIEAKQTLWNFLLEKYGEEVVWDKFSINSRTLNSFYNAELEIFNEKAMRGEVTGDFHLPGVDAPTAHRDLSFRKEK